MMSRRRVQIVKGVPTLSAEYKRARVLAAGHDFEVMELSTQRCKVRGRRAGASKWLEITFTMDDARTAQIVKDKGAWKTRPRRMLFARAGSELCDFIFADVTNGLPTAELVGEGDGDDGFAGYNESPAQAPPSNGHAPAASPRTAQRRQRPTPAKPATATASTVSPATPQTAPSEGLPPLPGEDEPGPTHPGSSSAGQDHPQQGTSPPSASSPGSSGAGEPLATGGQVGIIQSHFKRLGFETHDRDERLVITAQIAGLPEGHDLGSTKELTQEQASAVADTLSRCKDRVRLMALVTKQEDGPGDE
jgi:hypothetical protein